MLEDYEKLEQYHREQRKQREAFEMYKRNLK
jgi:hypothetical protein